MRVTLIYQLGFVGAWICWYTHRVVKDRWIEAEPIIMTDPKLAYEYARYIIKGRWPEAEPIIMKNSEWAFVYIRDVIKRRRAEEQHNKE